MMILACVRQAPVERVQHVQGLESDQRRRLRDQPHEW